MHWSPLTYALVIGIMLMQGLVKTIYASPDYMKSNCQTPITPSIDVNYSQITCLDIENAGQCTFNFCFDVDELISVTAYHNAASFLGSWALVREGGEGASTEIAFRPNASGLLFDNTTVIGSWITTDSSNMTASFEK
jgi:hypothetical protein